MFRVYARNSAGQGRLLSRALIAIALLGAVLALNQIDRESHPAAQVSIQPE